MTRRSGLLVLPLRELTVLGPAPSPRGGGRAAGPRGWGRRASPWGVLRGLGPALPRAGAPRPGGRRLTGRGALGYWTTDAPGVRRKITTEDLAEPYATRSANNRP